MAHKKAQGSTSNGRDSVAKRLGLKKTDGELVRAGEIIIKQRGTKYRPGKNVLRAKDDTLYAAVNGTVKFKQKKLPNFHGALFMKTLVEIIKAV
ncbi:MAG: 50S ribosomal protein L27 [Patescibacteria group bacterium]|jgi:large subunit ribosomal protein L27